MYSLAKPLAAVLLLSLLFALGCSPAEEESTLFRGGQAINTQGLAESSLVREVTSELINGNIVGDQLMLKFTSEATGEQIAGFFEKYDLEILKHLGEIDFYNIELPEDLDLAIIAGTVESHPLVDVCEPVFIERAFDQSITPNDGYFPDEWGLFHINAPQAWVIEPGFGPFPPPSEELTVNDVLVAVLDTGIDYKHPDMNPSGIQDNLKFIEGLNLIPNGNQFNDPMDDHGHGTMVAGIIGALTDNTIGISSVTWQCRLLGIKVLDDEGNGTSVTSAEGILYAANQYLNAKNLTDPYDLEGAYFNNPYNARLIINMSYGFRRSNVEGPLQSEAAAVAYAVEKGALLVAAAGDDGTFVDDGVTTVYPAGYEDVIAVGAIDQANGMLLTSNKPSLSQPLDSQAFLVAPGKDIISTSVTGYGAPYAVGTGTSFAAPFVSGAAGLIWAQYPFLTAEQVKNLLKDSANADSVGSPGIDAHTGWGLVDVYAALQETFTPFEDDMIVRAFTNPILHGDIIFVVRTKYEIMKPPKVAVDGNGELINDGYPLSYNIGFDDDGDGIIDEPITTDWLYYPNEVVFFQLDNATYLGRVHLMQDLGLRLGTLMINVTGVPRFFLDDPTLPKTISAQTSIEITEFNYS